MSIPSELRYTKDHEWLRIEGNEAVIGITEFAQGELGDIVFAELPAVGKAVSKGDSLCVVESTKAASDVYAPVTGKISAVNDQLTNSPELINQSPYTDGWMVRLAVDSADQFSNLLTAEQYQKVLGA